MVLAHSISNVVGSGECVLSYTDAGTGEAIILKGYIVSQRWDSIAQEIMPPVGPVGSAPSFLPLVSSLKVTFEMVVSDKIVEALTKENEEPEEVDGPTLKELLLSRSW